MEAKGDAKNPEDSCSESKHMGKLGNSSSASPGSKSPEDGCDEFKRVFACQSTGQKKQA